MSLDILSQTAKFKVTKIHDDIVAKYLEMHPEFSTKADVFRHAIALLDEKMRKDKGEDDVSLLKKDVTRLVQSINTMKTQMDVLIKLNIDLISRSGSNVSYEDMEQVVKSEIGSSVTKRAENRFPRKQNHAELGSKGREEMGVSLGIQKTERQPFVSERRLPMISDEDRIVLKYGDPHKVVMKVGKPYYEPIEWEQIPEHRHSQLK
ncbi:hypothetical protein IEE_05490 [Bacillus cereus BAG5X1-1]|uniref:Uncharacterized protein n=1 Tax=Bacillus cereus BAG5X1-1 TaxID=1053189 RepID=J8ABM3_BACCE|nr:hypothetical protein [Bacillus cereus]EJQ36014.1 hypothetical protein IEE_05490 [Bacillus cereus BAG5X1-1]